MYIVKGVWVFNDTLTVPTWTEQSVDFTVSAVSDKFYLFGSDWVYFVYGTSEQATLCYEFTDNKWLVSEEYKTVDFGETEQTVSEDFYRWLVVNATQQLTLEEQLVVITENQQKVFDAGYAKGKAEGGSESSYDEGYADGQQAEYDRFWDLFQDYGNRDHYYYAFNYWNFDDTTFNPKYPIKAGNTNTGGQCLFYESRGITDTKVDISLANVATQAFYNAKDIKTIRKLIVNENVTFTRAFDGTSALENITFEGVIGQTISFLQSPLLSAESVQSIIDALKDLTGATTQTLTFHATVGGKLTDEQKATITAKNWTLVY